MRPGVGGLLGGALLGVLCAFGTLRAQQPPARPDTTTQRADTTRPRPPRRVRPAVTRELVKPPISPRRALLYSLFAPGTGQARLGRTTAGAFFVGIEAAALTMAAKSAFDLSEAKAFRGDSLLPSSFPVDSLGNAVTPAASTGVRNNFSQNLVRARRVHLEDWLAVIAFNHLIAGAEAFVSANLWSVPAEVSVEPSRHGAVVAFRARW